jgi:hypothetical protein
LHGEFLRHIEENKNYRWQCTINKTELSLYQAASIQGDWNMTMSHHGVIKSWNVPHTAFILNNQHVLDKAFFQDFLILEDQGDIFLQYAEHDHSVTNHHTPETSS